MRKVFIYSKVFIILFILLFFNQKFCYSQCSGGNDPGCDPLVPLDQQPCSCPCTTNPICPIDSGVYYLLAAGLGYGIIRIRKQRKKNVPA